MPFKPATPSTANRGKAEEAEVQKFLEALGCKRADFDFLRLPDARSAGGRMKSMPGDYEYFMPFAHGIIEVKAVDHPFRIAKDKVSQLASMKKRELAGGKCFLVVHHTPTDVWRVIRACDMAQDVPSWDFSLYPNFDSAASALLSTGAFE
jgi:Holliday junction resolvase